jgi:hypothetical protein
MKNRFHGTMKNHFQNKTSSYVLKKLDNQEREAELIKSQNHTRDEKNGS